MPPFDTTFHSCLVNAKRALTEARILASEGRSWLARSRYRDALDAWHDITSRHREFGLDMEAVAREFEKFNAQDKGWQEQSALIKETLAMVGEIFESELRNKLRISPPSEFYNTLYHLEKDGVIIRKKAGNEYTITLADPPLM